MGQMCVIRYIFSNGTCHVISISPQSECYVVNIVWSFYFTSWVKHPTRTTYRSINVVTTIIVSKSQQFENLKTNGELILLTNSRDVCMRRG